MIANREIRGFSNPSPTRRDTLVTTEVRMEPDFFHSCIQLGTVDNRLMFDGVVLYLRA